MYAKKLNVYVYLYVYRCEFFAEIFRMFAKSFKKPGRW